MYVGDLHYGFDTVEDACRLSWDVVYIFKDTGMNLRKLRSISDELDLFWMERGYSVGELKDWKTLGSISIPKTDKIKLNCYNFDHMSEDILCGTIYSDNATLQSAESELKRVWNCIRHPFIKNVFAFDGIMWKYIVQRRSWWGGFWERHLRTIKTCLRKIIGQLVLLFWANHSFRLNWIHD